ncbi:M16 family metallopeptidase [Sphingomonas colocasiae]|uniref:Insulinase family protein n=1 Tax=Sphingomonas colocasiae TaxID=1848973 RepID=A0ABS7PPJ5_9SPHN|nr:insulinase family protein [Sphingomonas colocasiae]MBY8823242.1 insulinase family protein [Sphingomonas colocasiae]
MRNRIYAAALCYGVAALLPGAPLLHGKVSPGGGVPRSPGASQAGNRLVGKLPNGLSYFIERGGQPGEKTQFSLIVRVGDAQYLPRENDVAHVVEHIVFNKLRDEPTSGTLRDRVARHGGVVGTDATANTGLVSTRYTLRMPNEPEAQRAALDILRDWGTPAALTDLEIDRERKVVIEEHRRSPPAAMRELTTRMRTWFRGNRYLDHQPDPIGTISATPASIRALHAKWYTPANMAVVVVGDIDPSAMLSEITGRFADLAAGSGPLIAADPTSWSAQGGRYVPTTGADQEETSVEVTFKHRATRAGVAEQAREAAMLLLSRRLIADAAANLNRRHDAPWTSLNMQARQLPGIGAAILTFGGGVKSGEARAALADILGLVSTIRRQGFGTADIERARADVLSGLPEGPLSATQSASLWEAQFISGRSEASPLDIRSAVQNLTPAAFNTGIGVLLSPADRDIFLFFPQADLGSIPSRIDVERMIRRARTQEPVRLDRPALKEWRLSSVPENPPAAATGAEEAGGFIRWTLPRSGATVLYRQVSSSKARLVMRRKGGVEGLDPEMARQARLAFAMVQDSGLGGLDKFELADVLAARKSSLQLSLGDRSEGLSVDGPASEWRSLLGLARTVLLEPQCHEAALRTRLHAPRHLGRSRASDDAAFFQMVAEKLGMKTTVIPAANQGDSAASLCALYRRLLGDARGMTIAVESDVPPEAVYPDIAAALDIPGQPFERIAGTDASVAETAAGRDVLKRGLDSSATVALTMQRAAAGGDRVDASWPLVGEIMTRRLMHRLREVEKGTYAANAALTGGVRSDRINFSINFSCDAANVDRLIEAAKDEVRRLAVEGISAEEYAAAIRITAQRPIGLSERVDRWMAGKGLLPAQPLDREDLNAAIRDVIDVSRLREFVRLPGDPPT